MGWKITTLAIALVAHGVQHASAAEDLLGQCYGKAPAGIALQKHLAAARSGNVESMWCAGAIHLYHQRRTDDALLWLTRAAEAGHPRAPLVLGILYEKGQSVPEDHALAVKWYQKGMDSGNAAAIRRLSEMYRLGMGVPHDPQKARELMALAEQRGDKAAPHYRQKQESDKLDPRPGQEIRAEAYRAYKQKQFVQAAKLYQQCAQMGNDVCELALGVHYELGEGVPKSDSQAVVWYRKAAAQGNPIAQKALGLMYQLGKGVAENWSEAALLFAAAAPKNRDAAYEMGRSYEFGMGVPQDRVRAIHWFDKAGKMGHERGNYWARLLSNYANCIGFRNKEEQAAVGFLRCPADPVGVTFRNSAERFAYLREKGREFDRLEAAAAQARANDDNQREKARAETRAQCEELRGSWGGAFGCR